MKGTQRAVNQLTLDGTFIKEFKKMIDAATETGTNYGDIASCCRGNKKNANGFRWEYCNKYIKLKKDPLDELLFIGNDDYDDEYFENNLF